MATVQDILNDIKENEIRWVDFQFVDLLGSLRHITVPARELDMDVFSKGVPKLDPSGIDSFIGSGEEMVLLPDPDTYARLPWDTISCRIICNIQEAMGGSRSEFDSRYIAKKTENALTGQGYVSRIGVQLDFFMFDSVTVDAIAPHKSQGYMLDSREGAWNFYGQNYPIKFGDGYLSSAPKDALALFRSNVSDMLEAAFKIQVMSHKHGYSSMGQCSIELIHSELLSTADNAISTKYVIKNAGTSSGLMPTFMPKPVNIERGNSMRVHQSLWYSQKNVFFDPTEAAAELSQTGRYYVGGILAHAPALCALANPTTNSYKRLLGEGMTHATWGIGNRSVAVRVPTYHKENEDSKRVQFRLSDPSCNPYLAISAVVLAGLDGIKNKLEPGDPVKGKPDEKQLNEKGVTKLPTSLKEALEALRSDSSFLKTAFPAAVIERYLELRQRDVIEQCLTPTPLEFRKYLDV